MLESSDNGLPDFHLKRILIRNLRRITNLDVEIPRHKRVICFVGANGGGKSALLSWIIDSLCELTYQSAPDLKKNGDVAAEGDWVRHWYSGEITSGESHCLIRIDWSSSGKSIYDCTYLKRSAHTVVSDSPFNEALADTNIGFASDDLACKHLHGRPDVNDDPVARSVFLVRPADRFEQTAYEEPEKLSLQPILLSNWEGERPLPIRVKSWGLRLEQLLVDMHTDYLSGVGAAKWFMQRWTRSYHLLTGEKWSGEMRSWPYRRYGPARFGQMSLLSAGELDILTTVALILAQKILITHNRSAAEWDKEHGPAGFVFIDEVDSHLHPQWQQSVVPLLTKVFPNIVFIISTHSPFVLRSMCSQDSLVVRLPDGEVFDEDFNAWETEEILKVVFQVSSEWSQEISKQLTQLRALSPNPDKAKDAAKIYRSLTRRDSAGLNGECRRIVGLYGSRRLLDLLEAR